MAIGQPRDLGPKTSIRCCQSAMSRFIRCALGAVPLRIAPTDRSSIASSSTPTISRCDAIDRVKLSARLSRAGSDSSTMDAKFAVTFARSPISASSTMDANRSGSSSRRSGRDAGVRTHNARRAPLGNL